MNLRRIKLNNFLSHRDTDFDLSSRNPVIVIGENGAGKSSLVKDSVTWCLFGKARGSGDELITKGTKSCIVEVEFELNSEFYSVIRTRELNKKTTLRFFKHEVIEVSLDGAVISETQAKIEQTLGMNYETFTTTACIEQGRANAFSTLTPAEAKRTVMNILQLNQYEKYLIIVRQQEAQLETNIKLFQIQQEDLTKQLDIVQTAIANLSSERQISANLQQGVKLYEQGLREVETESKSIEAVLSVTAAQGVENTMYRRQLTDAIKNVENKKLKLIKSETKCPLCTTVLTADHLATVLAELDKRLLTYHNELEKSQSQWSVMNDTLQHNQNQYSRLKSKRLDLERDLKNTNTQLQQVQQLVGMLAAKEQEQKVLEISIGACKSETTILSKLLNTYRTLDKAFGKDGIPALIIENVIPEIEQIANRLLGLLSDNKLQLQLKTQKELKTGGIGDTLEIIVLSCQLPVGYGIIEGTRYESMSGGEQFRVDLALRIALSSVMARRNSFKCETLIVDEGFGSLDAMGKQKFVELSKMLGDQFKRLIIITHTDVADSYSDVVTVRKENGSSKIN